MAAPMKEWAHAITVLHVAGGCGHLLTVAGLERAGSSKSQEDNRITLKKSMLAVALSLVLLYLHNNILVNNYENGLLMTMAYCGAGFCLSLHQLYLFYRTMDSSHLSEQQAKSVGEIKLVLKTLWCMAAIISITFAVLKLINVEKY